MAGFSSTVTPVRAAPKPWQPNPRGLIYSGKGYNGLKPPAPTIQSGSWAPVAPPAPPRLASRPGPEAPGQTPGTSATTTSGPQLDSTALGNIASNQFKVNNQINGLNQSSSNIGTNLQAALGQLAYQQPRQQLSLEQGANRQGSLYSTAYNQRLGDLNQNFLTRQNTATTNAGQRQSAIASQIQALLGGVPLYNKGQADASVQRAIAAALANPATGQPAVVPPASSAASGGAAGVPSTRPPAKQQKTIIQLAAAGHPNWFPKPKPKAIQSGSWRRG